jgi:hypothetical protein
MSYDSAAWGALAFALSTMLGVITFFRWRARGLVAGLRGAGWTVLPVAAWLTGVLELAFDVGDSVGHWAVHLVFSPVVWLGIVLAGVSAVLFGTAALLGGRGGPDPEAAPPALGAARGRQKGKGQKGRLQKGRSSTAATGDDLDDLDDIEAILRRHGIS